MFRDEAKTNPCHHTLNNLGVFYLYEGLMLNEYKRRSANFLGLCYLNKAFEKQCTYENYFGLGVGNFAINNFPEANQQFDRAFQTKNSYGSFRFHSKNTAVNMYKNKYIRYNKVVI